MLQKLQATPVVPVIGQRLTVLRRQIDDAQNSLIIHLTLHDVVDESLKTVNGRVAKESAHAFHAISNASLNNLIVMTHQIFDGTKPAYSLRHAKSDKTLCKNTDDTDRLRKLFKGHKDTIQKVGLYRNSVAAHASFTNSATAIVNDLQLDIWTVKSMLQEASACVEALFLANPVLGMQIPGFGKANERLETQLKDVFAKGFG